MLTQKRIGVPSITSLSIGAIEGEKISNDQEMIQSDPTRNFMSKSRIFLLHNLFSAIILCKFLEMIMLIS